MRNHLRKLRKYTDLTLHRSVFGVFLKFIFLPRERLLTFIRIPLGPGRSCDGVVEKIRCYVSMYSDVRRKFGVRGTCLTKSFLLCRALRENGVDARVQFGLREAGAHEKKISDGGKALGHCWVGLPGEDIPHEFPLVVTCP